MTPIQWARMYAKSAINGFGTLSTVDAIDNALSDLDSILRRLEGADDAVTVFFVVPVESGRRNSISVGDLKSGDLSDLEIVRLVGVHRLFGVNDLPSRDKDLVLGTVIDRSGLEEPIGHVVFVSETDELSLGDSVTKHSLESEVARRGIYLGLRRAEGISRTSGSLEHD